jgi:osmotically-inducible protein OsmY
MITRRPLGVLTFALILFGALPGCAAYRKCGFEGCAGDASITASVQNRLDQHPELSGLNSINVQTLDHVVYLSGFVSNSLDRGIAKSVAAQAPGVTRVVNNIAVSH